MANLLTAIRLLLVAPVAMAIANENLFSNWALVAFIIAAIASDYFDGKVARALNTASARGMLFDHGTDFIFVTTALYALSTIGLSSILLPILITVAFSQYVLDSYYLFKQKQLRMSFLGRWNGVFYFVPVVLIAASRIPLLDQMQQGLQLLIVYINYALAISTLASIVDRAIAPMLHNDN
jgi:phosphatidylglycerophosphate synthase